MPTGSQAFSFFLVNNEHMVDYVLMLTKVFGGMLDTQAIGNLLAFCRSDTVLFCSDLPGLLVGVASQQQCGHPLHMHRLCVFHPPVCTECSLPYLHVPPQWGKDIQTVAEVRRIWSVVDMHVWLHLNSLRWSLLPANP